LSKLYSIMSKNFFPMCIFANVQMCKLKIV
jgi:hypothetical protein